MALVQQAPDAPPRPGHFIALEGGDGAGRSTQVRMLLPWLEELGWAPVHVGLGRSQLTRRAFRAYRRQAAVSGVHTLGLLYAADLTEQAERRVGPALAAGFVVIADRWSGTALARCAVRGARPSWLDTILPASPRPGLTVHLHTPPGERLRRQVHAGGLPPPQEWGSDLALGADALESFVRYQDLLDRELQRRGREAGWQVLAGGGDPREVQRGLRSLVLTYLEERAPGEERP